MEIIIPKIEIHVISLTSKANRLTILCVCKLLTALGHATHLFSTQVLFEQSVLTPILCVLYNMCVLQWIFKVAKFCFHVLIVVSSRIQIRNAYSVLCT